MKLISSQAVVGKMSADFNVNNTGWIGDGKRWIKEGVNEIGVFPPENLVITAEEVTIEDYKVRLPCTEDYLRAVTYNGYFITSLTNRVPIQELQKLVPDIDVITSDAYTSIQGNYLHTTFKSGTITLYYEGLPIDKEGWLMIPDLSELTDALCYKILTKLMLRAFTHPVISLKDAREEWEQLKGQCRNIILLPTPEQNYAIMDAITNKMGVSKYQIFKVR